MCGPFGQSTGRLWAEKKALLGRSMISTALNRQAWCNCSFSKVGEYIIHPGVARAGRKRD